MEDLIPPRMKEICKLTMPEGLKELMSDITREVLRAQPTDLYGFIASYLSALLVTRDNLTIADRLCSHVCNCDCQPELYRELVDIGLSESDAAIAQNVIIKHFSKEKVDEGNLLSVILAKTSIAPDMVSAVVNAVRTAYLCHQSHNYTKYESSSDDEQDEAANAAKHTLNIYRETRPTEEQYHEMAGKIQASYRAFGVRRTLKSPHRLYADDGTSSSSSFSEEVKEEMKMTASMAKRRMNTVSSLSLAGSYCILPAHNPYNAHETDCLSQLVETSEKEHAHIDYTARSPHLSVVNDDKNTQLSNKKISFQHDNVKSNKMKNNQNLERIECIHETVYDEIDELISINDNELDYKNLEDMHDSVPEVIYGTEDDYDVDVSDEASEANTVYRYVNVMNKEVESDSDDEGD